MAELNLQEFGYGQVDSSESFAAEIPSQDAIPNTKTTATMSAEQSLLSDDPIGNFPVISSEHSSFGNSPTGEEFVNNVRTNEKSQNEKALIGILGSPEYSFEMKQQAFNALNTEDKSSEQYLIAVKQLTAPVPDEPIDVETSRINALPSIQQYTEYNKRIRNLSNADSIRKDVNAAYSSIDLATAISRNVDNPELNAHLNEVIAEPGKKHLNMMYPILSTIDYKQAFNDMDIDDVYLASRAMIELVTQSQDVNLSSEEFKNVKALQESLASGYGNEQGIKQNLIKVYESVPVFGVSPANEDSSFVSAVASDLGVGITEIPSAIVRGGAKAWNATIDLLNDAYDWASAEGINYGIYWDEDGLHAGNIPSNVPSALEDADIAEESLPDAPTTVTGSLVEGLSQFMVGFVGAGKISGVAKVAGTARGAIVEGAARGAIVDFTVFEEQEQRLTDLLSQYPEMEAFTIDYLKSDPSDGPAEGRFKNALEGLALGGITEGIFKAIRSMRGLKHAPKKGLTPKGASQVINEGEEQAAKTIRKELEERGLAPDSMNDAPVNKVAGNDTHGTPGQVIKDTNPESAKVMDEAVIKSEDDAVAEAMTGQTKGDYIASRAGEKAKTSEIKNEPHFEETIDVKAGELITNKEVTDLIDSMSTGSRYTAKEFTSGVRKVKRQITKALGKDIVFRQNMSQVDHLPGDGGLGSASDGVTINGIYGSKDGGFATAIEAVDKVNKALGRLGIVDRDINVFVADGNGNYLNLRDHPNMSTTEGSFYAGIDTELKIGDQDIADWSSFDIALDFLGKRVQKVPGVLARMSWSTEGTLLGHLFDANSFMDPEIIKGIYAGENKVSQMEHIMGSLSKEFADLYNKIGEGERFAFDALVKQANELSVTIPDDMLMANLSTNGVQAYKKFREFWDTAYYVENKATISSNQRKGFKVFDNTDEFGNQTHMLGKPASVKKAIGKDIYNFDEDTLIPNATGLDLDEKLASGDFTLFELKDPAKSEDMYKSQAGYEFDNPPDEINYVLVKNQEVRSIADNDKLLAYREGYYTVNYEAPVFITKQKFNKRTGKPARDSNARAVQTVGSIVDAKNDIEGLQKLADQEALDLNDGYFYKYDYRGDLGADVGAKEVWQTNVATGRSTMQMRGKRLSDGFDDIPGEQRYMMSPYDSMIKSAMTVSKNVAMPDYLDTMKKRFIKEFSDVLPTDGFGNPRYPVSRAELKTAGKTGTKAYNDALAAYTQIYKWEYGYRSGLDDTIKATFKALAEGAGEAGHLKREKAYRELGAGSALGTARSIAFHAMVGLRGLKQWFLTMHHPLNVALLYPQQAKYIATRMPQYYKWVLQGRPKDPSKLGFLTTNKLEQKEILKSFNDFEYRSGLPESVQANALLVNGADDIAQSFHKTKFTKGIAKARHVSFELPEHYNNAAAFFGAYGDYTSKLGKRKLSQREVDDVAATAKVNNFSMTRSGTFDYTQNSLATAAQFVAIGHKGLLMGVSNRFYTPKQRAAFAVGSLAMYGLPITLAANLFAEDPDIADAAGQGILGLGYSQMLETVFEEEVKVSTSQLGAFSLANFEFLHGVFTTGLVDAFIGSASFNAAAQAGQAVGVTGDYFIGKMLQPFNPDMEFESDIEFMEVLHRWANLVTPYSDTYKVYTGVAAEKFYNKRGDRVVDGSVSLGEAIGSPFGLKSLDELRSFTFQKTKSEIRKKMQDDVKTWYRDMKAHLNFKYVEEDERDINFKALRMAFSHFKGDQTAYNIIISEMRKDLQQNDAQMLNGIVRLSGILTHEQYNELITGSNMSQEGKKRAIDAGSMFKYRE